MNPDRIYQQHRDDAMAVQFEADSYSTFVAMPFAEQFSYRSRDIYTDIIQAASAFACQEGGLPKKFAKPKRIDDGSIQAKVITEEIIVQTLESHIFLADLTFQNAGVLLETGIALGLKPTAQIILIMQGNRSDLHFDIRNNNVITYNDRDQKAVEKVGKALIGAAKAWEEDCHRYIVAKSRMLTPEAIACLRWYGFIQQQNKVKSLHPGAIPPFFPSVWSERSKDAYREAIRELLRERLLWTDYKVDDIPDGDAYGGHATALGWAMIEHMWPQLKRTGNGVGSL